jgi:ATP-dependent Zn protease
VEELLYAGDIPVIMQDMPSENWFMYYVLPMLVVFVVFIFFFSLMNSHGGGGGANNRMMNFGKSRARMTGIGEGKITLKDVAGLREEKEELEEIVDFLRDPLKFTKVGARIPKGVLLEGPPGTGKTTLAQVIAHTTSSEFTQLNATVAGKKDMEEVIAKAKETLGMYGKKTILFVDEIHRFNKSQQDYLLPFVEDGTVSLIGATTENPYFEVNGALISRSVIFELKPLSKENVEKLNKILRGKIIELSEQIKK